MARVISVVNQKGGVGKTTTAINVSAGLATLDQRVLLIDIDAQGNGTSGLGVDPRTVERSIYNVLVGEAQLADVVVETAMPNLFLAPAATDLAGASVELVEQPEREFRLRQAVATALDDYDIIVIDCPPSLGVLTINGIVGANEILIPVQAEYYALEGLGQLLKTIDLVQEHLQPDLQVLGAVLTMYDRRNKLANDVFTEMYSHFPYRVFGSVIPRNVRLAEAPSYGKPILAYDQASRGAKAYLKLAREILLANPSINPRSVLSHTGAPPEDASTNS